MSRRISSVAAAVAGISLCVSPAVANASSTAIAASTASIATPGAAPAGGVSAALAQSCAASIGVAAAAAAQAVRPGCVLPAVGTQPIVAQTVAPAYAPAGIGFSPFPIIAGLAAVLLGAYLLIKDDSDDIDIDLSPG